MINVHTTAYLERKNVRDSHPHDQRTPWVIPIVAARENTQ